MKKLLLLLLLATNGYAHDIDNLSTQLNAFPAYQEASNRYFSDKPLHCADGLCEGQFINACLANPQVGSDLRTMFEVNKNFWHWRRQLLAQIEILAGEANFARGIFLGKNGRESQIPFIHYDPFYLGHDPHFPKVFNSFKAKTGLDPYSALEVRYDYFTIAHVIYFPSHKNIPLAFKRCKDLTKHEAFHAPECRGGDPEALVLSGGDSYKAPKPFRDEDAFIYYDRMPANPIADACFGWYDKRWGFDFALVYARAHELAGKTHAAEVYKRVMYIRMVVDYISRGRR